MTTFPPSGYSTYRVITGTDDTEFCDKVSEALELGYKLQGSPSITFNGQTTIIAQALIWPSNESKKREEGQDFGGENRQPRRNFRERDHAPRERDNSEGPRHNTRRFGQKNPERNFNDAAGFKSVIKRFDEDNNFKKHLSRSTKSKTPKW